VLSALAVSAGLCHGALAADGSISELIRQRPPIVETPAIKLLRKLAATPEASFDIAAARLELEKVVVPSVDVPASLKKIDQMAQTIRSMVGPSAPSRARLSALRHFLYDSGSWNDNNPFHYNLHDPNGSTFEDMLLSRYIRNHMGNCVSMPILFVALSDRLGLHATLSTAPNHIFVKYFDDVTGKTFNLETTSGAHPARDEWIRQNMSMSDQAITNGVYLKALSKKEEVALLAEIVIEYDTKRSQRYQEAWDIADTIRPLYPNDTTAILTPQMAAAWMLHTEYEEIWPVESDVPPALQARLHFLEATIRESYKEAKALGWRPDDGESQAANK